MSRNVSTEVARERVTANCVHRPGSTADRIALVTGASSGIGQAISLALARAGVRLCVVGRSADRLAQTVASVQSLVPVESFQLDLVDDVSLQPVIEYLETNLGKLDILIHSAGMIHQAWFEQARIEHLDQQYATNVRAPYLLTQRLLPLLVRARGQIVFINSSAGLSANRPEIGQYAATKHALKAIADSVRAEVNPRGVRVLSVYLGRTATAMQESLFKEEGRTYYPEKLLQPEDVAIYGARRARTSADRRSYGHLHPSHDQRMNLASSCLFRAKSDHGRSSSASISRRQTLRGGQCGSPLPSPLAWLHPPQNCSSQRAWQVIYFADNGSSSDLGRQSVRIGQMPGRDVSERLFDSPDVVIPVGPNGAELAKTLDLANTNAERLRNISRRNAAETALRHDWAYRWRQILDIAGFAPTPALEARARRLRQLAENANTDIAEAA